jgi:hypothetical protein
MRVAGIVEAVRVQALRILSKTGRTGCFCLFKKFPLLVQY